MYSKDVTVTSTLSWVEKASVQSHSKKSRGERVFRNAAIAHPAVILYDPSMSVCRTFFVSVTRGHKIWTLVISYETMIWFF
jgi:hypothetical protein